VPTPFFTTLRVRYVECDMQGHVFNAHYLTWFDLAHTELLRQAIGSYADFVQHTGRDFVVAESGVRYLAPARFDDELSIGVAPEPPTTSSLTSRFTVLRGDDRLAEGFLRHVCVDTKDYAKAPWPEDFRSALAPYVVE
jgi:acyl-CoA thioester hydrolase